MSQHLDICRASIERHSKSFALASRLLPHGSRGAARAVYAWCRRADDAIDGDATANRSARETVQRLERELSSVYAGEAQPDPILEAFQGVVRSFSVPEEYPAELLSGMRMDAEGYHYERLDDLLLYSFRVAGTVGLMMCHVLGIRQQQALRHASHLGIAMQLTNVCRDVLEDWQRGRLYLPRELLVGAGAADLRRHLGQPFPASAIRPSGSVLRALLETADRYYASGHEGLRYLDLKSALAVRTAALVYADIGRQIARGGHDVLAGRAVVSRSRKIWLLTRAGVLTALQAPRRLFAGHRPTRITQLTRFPHDVLPV